MKQMTRKKFDEAVEDKQLVMDDEQPYSMIYVVQTARKREGFHMLAVYGFTDRNSDANPDNCQLLGYCDNVLWKTGELTDSMELHCDSHMNGVTRYWFTSDRAKFLVNAGWNVEITCVRARCSSCGR